MGRWVGGWKGGWARCKEVDDNVDRKPGGYFVDSPWFTVRHGHGAIRQSCSALRAFLGPNGGDDVDGWVGVLLIVIHVYY